MRRQFSRHSIERLVAKGWFGKPRTDVAQRKIKVKEILVRLQSCVWQPKWTWQVLDDYSNSVRSIVWQPKNCQNQPQEKENGGIQIATAPLLGGAMLAYKQGLLEPLLTTSCYGMNPYTLLVRIKKLMIVIGLV